MNEIDSLRIKLRFTDRFEKLIDSLCLTDRQKEIARLKYIKGWANVDIGEYIGVCRKTVTEEMKVISSIMGSVDVERFIDDLLDSK